MGKISCFHCTRKCKGDVLKVGEKYFHKECFTCKICHKKLDDSGFFSKDECFYCAEDYKTYCAAVCFSCQEKVIGEVVTALNHTFHRNCFKCSICQKNFIPGDKVSMKNTSFLCNECSGTLTSRDNLAAKIENQKVTANENSKLYMNGRTPLYGNQISTNSQIKDSDSFSVPIRRKIVTNKASLNYQVMSNSLNRPISSPSTKLPASTGDDESMGQRNSYGSSLTTPRHFHVPPGNNRYWMYNSMVVGSKNHPLALSASNLNRTSLSNSTQKIEEDESLNKENIKKLSSYPSGYVNDRQEVPLDRNDWPAPPAPFYSTTEKNRRKAQNPTVEALSAGTTPKIRKARSNLQSGDSNTNLSSSRIGIAEVLKRSTTDCSSYEQFSRDKAEEIDIPKDPVSASRCPSAVCEPLVPPRYDFHTETSPSRNDDFFKQTERHLGYSMEFVNSTSRAFISDSAMPKSRKNLRNSYAELRPTNSINHTGSLNPRSSSGISTKNDHFSFNDKNRYHSTILSRDSDSFINAAIPYSQLRISNRKMLKNLERTRLETYLSDEEFQQLFNLSRAAFYQLPEWKRNDLKKQVDLF